ncbi:unnamed protein product, partial [Meganyctiphanes norvegica]
EPETSWSGTGVWGGLVAMICGLTGLVAHKLWYKNFAIKGFLVTSVSTVLVCLLGVGITLYSIINREERFLRLLEEAKKNPWFASLSPDHHRPTLNVSINLVVGFVLELLLAVWSTKVAWRGVRATEFSSSQREAMMASQQERQLQLYQHAQQQYAAATSAAGPQIPLAALYQLLQAHPELLGAKASMNNSSWVEEFEKHRTSSMDYHERVDRYLANSHDNRPPSTLHNDSLDQSASTSGESSSESNGRGSPSNSAETVVCTNNRPNVSSRRFSDVASVDDLSEPADTKCNKQNKRESKSKAPKPHPTPNSSNENTVKIKATPNRNDKQKFDAVKNNATVQEKMKENEKVVNSLDSDSNIKKFCENEENMDRGIKILPSDIKRAIVVEDFNCNEEVSNLNQEKTNKVLTLNKENQCKDMNDKDLRKTSKTSEKVLNDKEIKLEMFEKTNEYSECANIISKVNKDKVTHIDAKPTVQTEINNSEAIENNQTEQSQCSNTEIEEVHSKQNEQGNESILEKKSGDNTLETK